MGLLPYLALTSAAPDLAAADLRAKLAAACHLHDQEPSDIEVVDYAGMLADGGPRLRRFCRYDPALGLRLARAVAEAPSPASGGAYLLLASFYEGAQGVKRDSALAQSYRRRAWLLGSELAAAFKTAEEANAYLASAESLTFLRERIARGAPPKERVRLAEALLVRRGVGDVAEALALLKAPETGGEGAARLLLANIALAPGAPAVEIDEAATRLRPLASSPSWGRKARPLIGRLASLQLAKAKTAEERWEAIQSLAAAAYAAEGDSLEIFRRAMIAANGGLEPATVDVVAPPPRLVSDDYPSFAMRRDISGQVRLRALVDPRGRIIFTEALEPGQPALLVDTVRRVCASRPVPPIAIPGPRPTLYVWIKLPAVNFRIGG